MGRAHGLGGEVVVTPETDHPGRFVPGASFSVPGGMSLTVAKARDLDGALLIRFEGVADRTAAEALRGSALLIDAADRRELGDDEFWPDQLVGLEIRDPEGSRLGTVIEVVEGTSQSRLKIETGEGIAEVPFVEELVPDVRIEDGFAIVRPIPGLLTPL